MKTTRSCSVDLLTTRINTLCIRLSLNVDKDGQKERKSMVLFENDLEQFFPAFLKVMHTYKKQKSKTLLAEITTKQQTLEFPEL